jgi:hypothetical protein
MPKRQRVPKPRTPEISAEALRLFRRGLVLQKAGKTEVWNRRGTCEYLHDVWRPLHIALGLAPWEMNVLDVEPERPLFGWDRLYVQSWPKARALRVALEQADQEARRRPPQMAAHAPEGSEG